jgi:hypothetical protein
MYEICKSAITSKINKRTITNEYIVDMKIKLALFLKCDEITSEQHLELVGLLNSSIIK